MCLNRVGLVAVLVAAIAAMATPVAAQTTSASVQGTVVDAQKGVLPGVTVTLKSKTQSEVLTAVTDGEGRFVFPNRPAGHLRAYGDARRFQDPRADQPGRERQRQALGGHADAGGRCPHGERPSLGALHRAAVEQRRALVHDGELDAHQHCEQRPHDVQLRDAGPWRALAERRRRHRARLGQWLHRERPAAELEQHDDRRGRQHRHGRQRRQHGDDQHRLGRRVQDADQLLPGRVRPGRGRTAPGGDQERHERLPWIGLLVRTAPLLERQLLDQQPRRSADPQEHARRPGLHDRRADPEAEAVLLLEPGVPEPVLAPQHPLRDGPDGPGAPGRLLAERGQQRQPVSVHS